MKKFFIHLFIILAVTVSFGFTFSSPVVSVKQTEEFTALQKMDCTYFEIHSIGGQLYKYIYACSDGRLVDVIPWEE